MKNVSIIVAVLVVLGVGGAVVATQMNQDKSSSSSDMGSMNMDSDKKSSMSDSMAETDLTAETEVTMDIKSFDFEKANIKIKKGTKVTWTNQDSAKHNVVKEGDGTADLSSELLAKGETYSYTFDAVGMTEYLCEPHPYMKGKINVVE